MKMHRITHLKLHASKQVMEVKLKKKELKNAFDIAKIKNRRTVRSDFLSNVLKKEDIKYLLNSESEFIHYLPVTSKESQFINEQTIVANRLQCDSYARRRHRNPAQQELADWIRVGAKCSSKPEYRLGAIYNPLIPHLTPVNNF